MYVYFHKRMVKCTQSELTFLEQYPKSFLLKMTVVGEDLFDAEVTADFHWDAVGQAIAFVEAGFVEFESFEKAGFTSGKHFNPNVEQNISDKFSDFSPLEFAVFGVKIEKFDQYIFGRDQIDVRGGGVKFDGFRVPLILRIHERNEMKRINKQLVPFLGAP